MLPNEFDIYTFDELLEMHRFYSSEPNNRQASKMCDQIEHILASRAIEGADRVLKESVVHFKH